MVSKIRIEWLSDHYICEDCGLYIADGYVAHVDGEFLCEFIPSAYCSDITSISREDAYKEILNKLGYELKESDYD